MISSRELERRRVPRFDVAVAVTLTLLDSQQEFAATCRDVSAGGMFCYVAAPLEPGRELRFTLQLPADTMLTQPVYLRGRGSVVRTEPANGQGYGLGVSFQAAEVQALGARESSGSPWAQP